MRKFLVRGLRLIPVATLVACAGTNQTNESSPDELALTDRSTWASWAETFEFDITTSGVGGQVGHTEGSGVPTNWSGQYFLQAACAAAPDWAASVVAGVDYVDQATGIATQGNVLSKSRDDAIFMTGTVAAVHGEERTLHCTYRLPGGRLLPSPERELAEDLDYRPIDGRSYTTQINVATHVGNPSMGTYDRGPEVQTKTIAINFEALKRPPVVHIDYQSLQKNEVVRVFHPLGVCNGGDVRGSSASGA